MFPIEHRKEPIGTLAQEMARWRATRFFDAPLFAGNREHYVRFFAVGEIERLGTPQDR